MRVAVKKAKFKQLAHARLLVYMRVCVCVCVFVYAFTLRGPFKRAHLSNGHMSDCQRARAMCINIGMCVHNYHMTEQACVWGTNTTQTG